MRGDGGSVGRWIGRGLLVALAALAALIAFGPRDRLDRVVFDDAQVPANPEAWLAAREAVMADILPGAEKQIVWAGAAGMRTPLAVIYVHGFSATKEEIRPVPDEVARALGANLFFTRLAGHGRGGAAMAEATAEDWLLDMAEALAVGRRLGDRLVVIGVSTGATLAAVALDDPQAAAAVAGVVLISPNFALRSPAGMILDLPWAPVWGPRIAGTERGFEPVNAEHGRWWTTRYPTAALFPMAELMRAARAQDWSRLRIPALFVWSPEDQVVDPEWVYMVARSWGGPVEMLNPVLTARDDPFRHVIAGRILSPDQTAPLVAAIVAWAGRL
jgi:alpha-beta hydrolase superfamily lysophospholipase